MSCEGAGELIVLPLRFARESEFTNTNFPLESAKVVIWAWDGAATARQLTAAKIAAAALAVVMGHSAHFQPCWEGKALAREPKLDYLVNLHATGASLKRRNILAQWEL
jgi:hypothetical protein